MSSQVKKSVAVFFNTAELGGAERSMIQQLCLMRNKFEITCFVPFDSGRSLGKALQHETFKICVYDLPLFFYQFSRKSGLFSLVKMGLGLSSLIFNHKKNKCFDEFDIWYANGNKSGVFLLFLKNSTKTLIWHWRDYPPRGLNGRIFKKVLNFFLKRKKNVQFIANSNSVGKELNHCFPETKVRTIYNFAGTNFVERINNEIKNIGIVSMLAPWKGLHVLILFFHIYEKKLIDLGIDQIKIYGAQIYTTTGEHTSYATDLKMLIERFPTSILYFEGLQEPQKIYQEIDLLIHYSLLPEPFGRVIAEAFWARVPVISTALGGAEELIREDRALKVFPHDFAGLFSHIEELVKFNDKTNVLRENSFQFIKEFEQQNMATLSQFLTEIIG